MYLHCDLFYRYNGPASNFGDGHLPFAGNLITLESTRPAVYRIFIHGNEVPANENHWRIKLAFSGGSYISGPIGESGEWRIYRDGAMKGRLNPIYAWEPFRAWWLEYMGDKDRIKLRSIIGRKRFANIWARYLRGRYAIN